MKNPQTVRRYFNSAFGDDLQAKLQACLAEINRHQGTALQIQPVPLQASDLDRLLTNDSYCKVLAGAAFALVEPQTNRLATLLFGPWRQAARIAVVNYRPHHTKTNASHISLSDHSGKALSTAFRDVPDEHYKKPLADDKLTPIGVASLDATLIFAIRFKGIKPAYRQLPVAAA